MIEWKPIFAIGKHNGNRHSRLCGRCAIGDGVSKGIFAKKIGKWRVANLIVCDYGDAAGGRIDTDN